MLTVHHLGISQSDRIVWLCEELGLDYELKLYQRAPETRLAPAEYKALHPSGTAPVITDGDLVLGESGAIIVYISRKYAGDRLLLGPEHPDFANFLYWFHFANGSMMPAGMIDLVLNALGIEDKSALDPLRARLHRAYAAVENRLGEAKWFAGSEFTAADIMMVFPLTTMRLFVPYDISGFPNIKAYLKRVTARPAFEAARLKADPDLPPVIE